MIEFDAAPAIPLNYHRLRALSPEEIQLARSSGYIAQSVDPSDPVRRTGIDNYSQPLLGDIRDWRTRVYIIWFCYIYENLDKIAKPFEAVEEIIMEFRAPDVIDMPGRRLGTLYAGMGGTNPASVSERKHSQERLKPHYDKALALLRAESPQKE